MNINQKISTELHVPLKYIEATIALLDGGATVPFIARYRKEVTGALNDTQLRYLEERLSYLRELSARQQTILKSIAEQNKLTDELQQRILGSEQKAELEDLYLPFKPKRRTKAQIAREAGLDKLAQLLWQDPNQIPTEAAAKFLNPTMQIDTIEAALTGAKYILMETFAEHAELLKELRQHVWTHALLSATVAKDKEILGEKFRDYFNYQEEIKKIPSHRALALFRGQREEILQLHLTLSSQAEEFCLQKIMQTFNISQANRAADQWLSEIVAFTWRAKIFLKLEIELMMQLRETAEEEGIKVFANNLKNLLMAAPAGSKMTLGLDPGLRTGVKVIVVDGTGKLLHHSVIFPHAPQNDWHAALKHLVELCKNYHIELVSIGNGTASRETDKLVQELKKAHPELKFDSLVVSEAGASVYSASELAAQEFPHLDVSYRGAVSIAKRLQDPLAELVKIDPKSIGVGQYQHDVNQIKLSKALRAVMEDCVNAVGVDVNTASVPLLTCVSGLNESVAKNIIQYRETNGAFKNRQQLKLVPRLGEKIFEQAAGFLRITNGDNPLDASAVHPEAYPVIERILTTQQKNIRELLGKAALLRTFNPAHYVDERFGLPTVKDILQELEKPGRDPRPAFQTAHFQEGIETIADLSVGMILEGVITNVANFGAFVDVGVHQDGLVHISMLANHFVKDPHQVVKVGDIVKVKVLEIDIKRKRISLTMRLENGAKKVSLQQETKGSLGNVLSAALKR